MSDNNGNVNITSRFATGTTDQRETIYNVRLPFTSELKEECSGSIGFKDFINNGTGAKPSFDIKLATLSYTNIAFTAVSHSSGDCKIGMNGKTNPSTALDVDGTVTCTGFNNTSDDRIKYNETNINTSTALNVINQLVPQKYEKIVREPSNISGIWIPTDEEWENEKNEIITHTYTDVDGNDATTTEPKWKWENETGLIAQDVKNISELSYCVIGNEVDSNGNQTPLKLNYNDIFSYHIAATKELTTQLNTANQKIATLESEIAAIKQHLGI